MTTIARRIRIWLAIVVLAVVAGTLGYVVFERWSFADGIYMTVITLTTVGYKEVHELDASGRIWTMILAIGGVALIFGSIGILAESVLAEVASGRREKRRMVEAIAALRGHFILCGYGRVGATVARELRQSRLPFVVVDITPTSAALAARDGCLVVEGDASNDQVLREAGIDRARGLITTVDTDAANVFVTLSARAINPGLFIVARANMEGAEAKLTQAGADRVVSPYTRAGRQIAELAARPRVADFIDLALSQGDLSFSLEEVEVAAGGPLEGKTMAALASEGIHPLAIVHGPNQYEPNPPNDRSLKAGESLIVSGTAETLRALRERA
jgi:voltage-gated potassium channel